MGGLQQAVALGQPRQQVAAEAIPGASGITHHHPPASDVLTHLPVADQRTVRPELEHHRPCSLRVAPVDDPAGLVQAGQGCHVLQAGQEDVAQADGLSDAGLRACQRPQLEAQVGVERHLRAGFARQLHGVEDGIAGARRDGHGNRRHMQKTRGADHVRRRAGQPLRCHAAGCRVCAPVAEFMAVRAVGDEIDAGVAGARGGHPAGVDAFLGPELQQQLTEGIAPDAGQVGAARASPGCGDCRVAGITTKTLQKLRLPGAGLVEFHHGLAQRGHLQ